MAKKETKAAIPQEASAKPEGESKKSHRYRHRHKKHKKAVLQAAPKVDAKETAKPVKSETTQKRKKLDHDITIHIHPRRIVRGVLLILIVLGVFFIGRLTAPMGMAEEGALVGEAAEIDSSFVDKITGFITASLSDASVEAQEELVDEVDATEDISEPDVAEEPAEEVAQETEEEPQAEEPALSGIITYSFDKVYTDWHGTWGEVTGIEFTINDGKEEFMLSHGYMYLEGYGELAEEVTINSMNQKVTLGKKTYEAVVENGFSYNEIVVGPLDNIVVKVDLFNTAGKKVTSLSKAFDLSG